MSEQAKTMLVPTEDQFSLTKVKMLKGGGLDIHYEVVETIDNETYINKYHVEMTKDIHPNLRYLFKCLRPIVARVFNITSYLSMVESAKFNATEEQQKFAREFGDACLDNIDVRGITLSGQGDKVGCILSAFLYMGGSAIQKSNLVTPRIKLRMDEFGFEDELINIVSDVESEVYAFLFDGKTAEMEEFGA